MSSLRLNPATIRTAAMTAAGVAALAGLSACEERPYSVPTRQATYAPPRPTTLAGAPTPYAPPPPVAYAPPPPPAPVYAEPAPAPTYVAPAPTYAEAPPPPPVQTYRPAPAYDTGGPMIVAMAPVPNPPEGYRGRRPHAAYAPAPAPKYGEAAPPRVVHHYAAARPVYHAPVAPRPAYVPAPAPKAPRYAAAPAPHPMPAPKTYAAAPPVKTTTTVVEKKVEHAAVATKTAAADAANSAKLAAAKTAEAAKAAAPVAAAKVAAVATKAKDAVKTAAAPAAPVATGGDRTTKLAALQSALTDAVSKNAVLTLPARFTANQPADVSMTLPASFAETVRKEADKQGLSDAAASVNMTSVLAGEGFSVTPDDTQSQPLTVGQPTEFHWTVTAQPGAKGPLHADVGADLLGGGSDTLSLGTVQKSAGMGLKLTPRMLGAGILALIVILVLGWLARGRNTPSRSSAARRAGRRARGAGYNRPLDMTSDDAPAH